MRQWHVSLFSRVSNGRVYLCCTCTIYAYLLFIIFTRVTVWFELGKLILWLCKNLKYSWKFSPRNYLFAQCVWNGWIPYLTLIKKTLIKTKMKIFVCVFALESVKLRRAERGVPKKVYPFYFRTNLYSM